MWHEKIATSNTKKNKIYVMGEIIFGFISGEVAVLLEKIEEKNHQKLKMFRYLSHL